MPFFDSPPPAPQRGDRATFSSRTDVFLNWLVTFANRLNTFVAGLNARDLGGANTLVYTFDMAIADSDPGMGKMRMVGVPQNTANIIRLSSASGTGADISAVLTALGAVTSNVKGSLRLQRVNDPTAWMILDVSAVTAAAGYFNLDVMVRSSSSPSPFVNSDNLALFVDRNGDKGDGGGTPTQQQIRDAVGVMPIANGGTGANTAIGARANLGAMSAEIPVVVLGTQNFSEGTELANGSMTSIATISAETYDKVALTIANNGNNFTSAVMQFHRKGMHAAFFGIDTDNKLKIGGRSMGPVAYEIYHQGNFNPGNYALLSGATFTGNVTAPAFIGTSDETLKGNWRDLPDNFLEQFAAIERAGLFDWLEDGRTDGGIGAQSVQKIAPWAVFEVDGILRVNYSALAVTVSHALARRVLMNEVRK